LPIDWDNSGSHIKPPMIIKIILPIPHHYFLTALAGRILFLYVEVPASRSRRVGAYCVIELRKLPSFVLFLIWRMEHPFFSFTPGLFTLGLFMVLICQYPAVCSRWTKVMRNVNVRCENIIFVPELIGHIPPWKCGPITNFSCSERIGPARRKPDSPQKVHAGRVYRLRNFLMVWLHNPLIWFFYPEATAAVANELPSSRHVTIFSSRCNENYVRNKIIFRNTFVHRRLLTP